MNTCPQDPAETAEAYMMQRLHAEDTAAFEEHYLACPACARELTATEAFIRAIRAAALKFERPGD